MARFRKYIKQSGTKNQKLEKIEEFVYIKFMHARDQLLPVRYCDFKRWGIAQAMNMSFHEFKASDTWVLNLKWKHGICSRKVTKVRVFLEEKQKKIHSDG